MGSAKKRKKRKKWKWGKKTRKEGE